MNLILCELWACIQVLIFGEINQSQPLFGKFSSYLNIETLVGFPKHRFIKSESTLLRKKQICNLN